MSDLVLYNYFRSSTSYRARIGLHLKNLSYVYKPIHLLNNGGEQHTLEYRKLSPAGEVPTLVHGSNVLGQSMAILEYLDEVFPQHPLFPKNPLEKAHMRQVCEGINCSHSLQNLKVLQFLEKEFGFSQEQKDQWTAEWIGRILLSTEKLISETAGDFAFGNSVSAADAFIVPQMFSAQRFKVETKKYALLTRINDNCLKHPAFVKAHPFRQIDTPADLRLS